MLTPEAVALSEAFFRFIFKLIKTVSEKSICKLVCNIGG